MLYSLGFDAGSLSLKKGHPALCDNTDGRWGIRLTEIRQTGKDKYWVISLTRGI